MKQPNITVERDSALRGYEVAICTDTATVPMVATVFISDTGSVFVNVMKEGQGHEALTFTKECELKLGQTYSHHSQKAAISATN